MTPDASALALDAVERRYGRGETTVEVLNGASLTLYAGQSVALIAPSGAGKSTLLHLAGLLERPNAGEVHDRRRGDLDDDGRGAHGAAAQRRSASSISSIICCRNSRRSRTSSCRR